MQIDLATPIDMHGAKVAVLSIREPRVADMLAVEKMGGSDAEKELRLFANLTECEPAALQQLTLRDYAKLQKAYQGFLS